MLTSLPFEPRVLQATEARLMAIYEAAKIGLRGDALAFKAGMLPVEYRRLQQLDPVVEMAELKGRAEGEAQLSQVLHEAALEGDAKVALEILKHKHDWVAKQSVQIDVIQQISVTDALAQARQRVANAQDIQDIEVNSTPAIAARPRPTKEIASHAET
jgi:hypothetical protein